jgi:hypothetical protein
MDYTTDYNMENTVRDSDREERQVYQRNNLPYNSARQVRNYYKQQTYAYRRTRDLFDIETDDAVDVVNCEVVKTPSIILTTYPFRNKP